MYLTIVSFLSSVEKLKSFVQSTDIAQKHAPMQELSLHSHTYNCGTPILIDFVNWLLLLTASHTPSSPSTILLYYQYKYQINVDGTVAAYRFPYLMGGGSLILKQDSQYYEHFYHHLEPWVHYVPLKRDLGDIVEKLQWALDHDDQV